MSKCNELFLTLFKDIKIKLDTNSPGTEEKPNYICFKNGETIGHSDIVRLVKQYQDSIIEYLMEDK